MSKENQEDNVFFLFLENSVLKARWGVIFDNCQIPWKGNECWEFSVHWIFQYRCHQWPSWEQFCGVDRGGIHSSDSYGNGVGEIETAISWHLAVKKTGEQLKGAGCFFKVQMFMLSSHGKVEYAGWREWALWSQIIGVGEGGIQNTRGTCGLWVRGIKLPLRWRERLLSGIVGLCLVLGRSFNENARSYK